MNGDGHLEAEDDRDAHYDGGDLDCNDRLIVVTDDVENDSASVCSPADDDGEGLLAGDEQVRSKSLTLNMYLTDLGTTPSTPLSPATPSERAGGVFTQMFRSCIALGHQTTLAVERDSGPVWVAFSTSMKSSGAMRDTSRPDSAVSSLRAVEKGVSQLVGHDQHWSGRTISTVGSLINEDYEQTLPEAPLTVGCVRTIADVRNETIRIDGLRGYHRLDIGQTQLSTGVMGIVSNNRVVYMTPGLSRWSMPTEVRVFKSEYTGLLCPLHTSMGPSAGSTRMVLDNVRARVMGKTMLSFLGKLISIVEESQEDHEVGSPECEVIVVGRLIRVSSDVVPKLMGVYRHTSMSYHTPTIHVQSDGSHVICVCTGALMRYVDGLGWVDSIMGDPSRRQIWDTVSVPAYRADRYTQLFCSQTAMTPFWNHMPEQRAALSGHFMNSSISLPANTMSHRIVPMYAQMPIIVTEHAKDLFDSEWVRYPGRNVLVLFMQSTLTYEDCFLMSQSCASGYQYMAETVVNMPESSLQDYNVGDKIPPMSQPWWGIPVEGTVVSVKAVKYDRTRMVVSRTCCAVSGDKFCTNHGQKGVVIVVPDRYMPVVEGRVVDFVMGSTTAVKRGTASQIYEAWASLKAISERDMTEPRLDTSFDVATLPVPAVEVTNNLLPDTLGTMSRVTADYGWIRLMQTCHMTFDKYQYTRKESTPRMRSSHRGRVAGGGVSLGEMEIQQLSGNGLTRCLEELQLRGNCVDASWCSACSMLTVTCTCPEETKAVSMIRISNSLLDLVMVMRCSSGLNVRLFK